MNKYWPFVLPGLLAFLSRAFVAAAWPAGGGDWTTYRTVAQNILWNGCVSLSDPVESACVPHWGGNQLPGFPAFIAAIWVLTPDQWLPVAIAHSLVFAAATAYAAWAIGSWFKAPRLALAAGLLVALSPLTVPWARFTLTETLALATNVWVFGELVRSLAERRLRVLPLAASCTAALFIRYDSALLAIPIAMTAFFVHPPWEAVKRGLLLALLVALPLGLWSARSVAKGLAPVPDFYFAALGHPMPTGYLAWGKTWATTQYEGPGWFYAVHTGEYSRISIPDYAFATPEEKATITSLLFELRRYDGAQFPAHIDQAFANIAAERKAGAPLNYALWLPFQRALTILWNPRNSAGWPVSLGVGVGVPPPRDLVATALANPLIAAVKVGASLYRVALFLGVGLFALWGLSRAGEPWRYLIWIALAYALERTAFMAWGFFMESRYLLEAVPFLEVAFVIGWAQQRAAGRPGAR